MYINYKLNKLCTKHDALSRVSYNYANNSLQCTYKKVSSVAPATSFFRMGSGTQATYHPLLGLRRILASHSLLHFINTLFYQSFFLCFFSLIVLFLVTTDEGSSPKHLVIQALGYILNLTKFMYLLVIIAARTNKHFISFTAFSNPFL